MASGGQESAVDKLHLSASMDDSVAVLPDRSAAAKYKKRRKKLAVKHAKAALNSLNTSCNTSLNTTLIRQTMRSNNRALARALEQKKNDLNRAHQLILQLQEKEQQLLAELVVLRRTAGLRDDEVEQEVNRRIANRMATVKGVLSDACTNQLSTVDLICRAMELCGYSTGRESRSAESVHSSRSSSIIASADDAPAAQPTCSVYYKRPSSAPSTVPPAAGSDKATESLPTEPAQDVPSTQCPLLEKAPGNTEADTDTQAKAYLEALAASTQENAASQVALPDLSIIMEQSYLDFDLPFTDEPTTRMPLISAPVSEEPDEELEGRLAQPKRQSRSRSRERRTASVYVPNFGSEAVEVPNQEDLESTDQPTRRTTRSRSRSQCIASTESGLANPVIDDSTGARLEAEVKPVEDTRLNDLDRMGGAITRRSRTRTRSRHHSTQENDAIVKEVDAVLHRQGLDEVETGDTERLDIKKSENANGNEADSTKAAPDSDQRKCGRSLSLRKRRNLEKETSKASTTADCVSSESVVEAGKVDGHCAAGKESDSDKSEGYWKDQVPEIRPPKLRHSNEYEGSPSAEQDQAHKASEPEEQEHFMPKFISLEDTEQEVARDRKKDKHVRGKSRRNAKLGPVENQASISPRKSGSDVGKLPQNMNDQDSGVKAALEEWSSPTSALAEELGPVEPSRCTRRGTFGIPAHGKQPALQPDEETHPVPFSPTEREFKKNARSKRGTFALPNPPTGLGGTTADDGYLGDTPGVAPGAVTPASRRETYCVPQPVNDDLGVEGILEQEPSMLVQSDLEVSSNADSAAEAANDPEWFVPETQEFLQPNNVHQSEIMVDSTICEAEDMELTGVINVDMMQLRRQLQVPETQLQSMTKPQSQLPPKVQKTDIVKRSLSDCVRLEDMQEPSFLKKSSDSKPTKKKEKSTDCPKDNDNKIVLDKELQQEQQAANKTIKCKNTKDKKKRNIEKLENNEEKSEETKHGDVGDCGDGPTRKGGRRRTAVASYDERTPGKSRGEDTTEEKMVAPTRSDVVETEAAPAAEQPKKTRTKKRLLRDADSKLSGDETGSEDRDGDESSENEKIKKKFAAYLSKPGKITFTAGRNNLMSFLNGTNKARGGRSKTRSKSILPRPGKARSKGGRSKPRALSEGSSSDPEGPDSIFSFHPSPRGAQDDLKPAAVAVASRAAERLAGSGVKETFELSLSESMHSGKPSFNQFMGREPSRPKSALASVGGVEGEESESPHGIMLVLGNGKRTKPRARSKSVRYAARSAVTSSVTPKSTPDEDVNSASLQSEATTPDRSSQENRQTVHQRGTPVRRDGSVTTVSVTVDDQSTSPPDPDSQSVTCVPESPFVSDSRATMDTDSASDSPVHPASRKRSRPMLSSNDEAASPTSSSDDVQLPLAAKRPKSMSRRRRTASLPEDSGDSSAAAQSSKLPVTQKSAKTSKADANKASMSKLQAMKLKMRARQAELASELQRKKQRDIATKHSLATGQKAHVTSQGGESSSKKKQSAGSVAAVSEGKGQDIGSRGDEEQRSPHSHQRKDGKRKDTSDSRHTELKTDSKCARARRVSGDQIVKQGSHATGHSRENRSKDRDDLDQVKCVSESTKVTKESSSVGTTGNSISKESRVTNIDEKVVNNDSKKSSGSSADKTVSNNTSKKSKDSNVGKTKTAKGSSGQTDTARLSTQYSKDESQSQSRRLNDNEDNSRREASTVKSTKPSEKSVKSAKRKDGQDRDSQTLDAEVAVEKGEGGSLLSPPRVKQEVFRDCEKGAEETSSRRQSERASDVSGRDSMVPEGRRSRRGGVVSYKEPSLGGKLRQGDTGTSTIYKGDVSKKGNGKRSTARSSDERDALSTISNTL